MKIDVSKLSYQKQTILSEDVVFDPEIFVRHIPLIDVLNCKVNVKTQRFEDFIYVDLSMVSKVILQCCYSLKHFETTIKGNDELHFSCNPEDKEDEDSIFYNGNIINLDEYIFNLLSASIPMSPKAPGAVPIKQGNGYRVLSEDELNKEKENEGNPQFDALKDLEL